MAIDDCSKRGSEAARSPVRHMLPRPMSDMSHMAPPRCPIHRQKIYHSLSRCFRYRMTPHRTDFPCFSPLRFLLQPPPAPSAHGGYRYQLSPGFSPSPLLRGPFGLLDIVKLVPPDRLHVHFSIESVYLSPPTSLYRRATQGVRTTVARP